MSACLCSHPASDHIGGGECIRWCGCGAHRPAPRLTADCRLPCAIDCEIGPVHCENWHRPNHVADWHDPATCDAGKSAPREMTG